MDLLNNLAPLPEITGSLSQKSKIQVWSNTQIKTELDHDAMESLSISFLNLPPSRM